MNTTNTTNHITLGVTAVIVRSGKVLLGKKGRAKHPEFVGRWVTPGGKVEFGESLKDATIREVQEETGLIVEILNEQPMSEIIALGAHYVFAVFECRALTLDGLKANSDLVEVKWFDWNEIKALDLTPVTQQVLQRYLGKIT